MPSFMLVRFNNQQGFITFLSSSVCGESERGMHSAVRKRSTLRFILLSYAPGLATFSCSKCIGASASGVVLALHSTRSLFICNSVACACKYQTSFRVLFQLRRKINVAYYLALATASVQEPVFPSCTSIITRSSSSVWRKSAIKSRMTSSVLTFS